jgi:hypothetical protein
MEHQNYRHFRDVSVISDLTVTIDVVSKYGDSKHNVTFSDVNLALGYHCATLAGSSPYHTGELLAAAVRCALDQDTVGSRRETGDGRGPEYGHDVEGRRLHHEEVLYMDILPFCLKCSPLCHQLE